jgi:hypothetical protein
MANDKVLYTWIGRRKGLSQYCSTVQSEQAYIDTVNRAQIGELRAS